MSLGKLFAAPVTFNAQGLVPLLNNYTVLKKSCLNFVALEFIFTLNFI